MRRIRDGFDTRAAEKIVAVRRLRFGRVTGPLGKCFTRNQGASSIFWRNAIACIARMRSPASFGAKFIIRRGHCNWRKQRLRKIQRRLRLGYTRAANVMDELENRGIVGPSKGAEPRDILIDLGVDVCTTPVEQPPIIQPHIVVCACEHCSGRIEFDANELGDRQSVSVSCPHCGTETEISNSC